MHSYAWNGEKVEKIALYKLFFEISKVTQFPEISSTFLKSKKTIIFAPKIVQYHYTNRNLGKFSLKTPKIADFP